MAVDRSCDSGHSDTGRARPTLDHLGALDGLRGVAVAAVVAYHLFPRVLPGGFLGVDVFFVLSGFLIASLVVRERESTGRLDLWSFYLRRLRRLTPAVVLLIAVVGLYAAVAGSPAEVARLRAHGLWSLVWLANWRFVLDGTTYTDFVVGVSPLRHMWSLAIEEQFYLVFPLVVLVLAAVRRGGSLRLRLAIVAGVTAMASAVWMVALAASTDGIERVYFGTDTRVQALLIGVVLGAVLVGRPPADGRAATVLARAALPSSVIVMALFVVAGEQSEWMYRGGFTAVALLVAVVIASVRATRWLGAALSWRPLVLLGLISYGVYLWHWPIIVLVGQHTVGVGGLALAAIQLALTLGIATVSYLLVEQPIRNGALGRRWGRWALVATPVGVVTAAVILVAGTVLPEVPTIAPRAVDAIEASGAVDGDGTVSEIEVNGAVRGATGVAEMGSLDRSVAVVGRVGSPPDAAEPESGPVPIVIMGDSVAHTLAGGVLNLGSDDHPPWSAELGHFDPAVVTMTSIARPRCSYLPGRIISRSAGRVAELDSDEACADWRSDLSEALAASGARVVVLVSANDTLDRTVEGDYVELGSPEWSTLYERHLAELSARVADAGAHLVLVTPPQRGGRFFVEADNESGWREAVIASAMESFAQDHPLVSVSDLATVVCPARNCEEPSGGFKATWRFDGLHFDGFGAHWFSDWISPQLLALDPAAFGD